MQGAQVAGDRALGNLEAQLEKLAVDPRSTPEILGCHPANEVAYFASEWLATGAFPFSGQPPPVQPETGPVPGNHGLGLHDDEDVCPARPDAPKGDPEGTIDGPDAGPAPLDQGGELLPKGNVLEQELPARAE